MLIHACTEDGVYFVRVRITDDLGTGVLSDTIEVTVLNRPTTALVSASSEAATNADLFDFDDGPQDLDGSIVSWSWDFGDGTTSSTRNPPHSYESAGEYRAGGPSEADSNAHVYEASGDYTVTLFVVDQDGGLSSTQTAISLIGSI